MMLEKEGERTGARRWNTFTVLSCTDSRTVMSILTNACAIEKRSCLYFLRESHLSALYDFALNQ